MDGLLVVSVAACYFTEFDLQHFAVGMRAACSFKHPLKSDSVEFCGWVCPHGFSKCFFSGISCPIELIF